MARCLKVIIDYDGTLTAEETQVAALAEKSLDTLAREIIGARREILAADYQSTRARLLRAPHRYKWEVNGLAASYCDEGAFILNTTVLQVMLKEDPTYLRAVAAAFPQAEYDPVMDCVNHLFHRHTAEISPCFRPAARDVLLALSQHPNRTPIILTNSLGDKVNRHLGALALNRTITVLGDTRQYDMDPDWSHLFPHPQLGEIQVWPVSKKRQIDLRRPVYYRALMQTALSPVPLALGHRTGPYSTVPEDPGRSRDRAADGSQVAVVADTLSLPGALPLMMSIPFFLLRTPYTPSWCARAVDAHPLGLVLDDLADLPAALDVLPFSG